MKKNKERSSTDSGYGSKNYSVQDQSAQHQPAIVMLPGQHDQGQYYDDYIIRQFDEPTPECSGTDSGCSSQVQTQSQNKERSGTDSGYTSQNCSAASYKQLAPLVRYCMPIPSKPTYTFDFPSAHSNNKLLLALERGRDKLAQYNSSDFGRHSPCSSDIDGEENDDYLVDVKVAKEKIMDSDDEGIEDEDEMQNASICMGTGSNSQDISSHLI